MPLVGHYGDVPPHLPYAFQSFFDAIVGPRLVKTMLLVVRLEKRERCIELRFADTFRQCALQQISIAIAKERTYFVMAALWKSEMLHGGIDTAGKILKCVEQSAVEVENGKGSCGHGFMIMGDRADETFGRIRRKSSKPVSEGEIREI